MRWLIRTVLFALGLVVFRLLVGYLFPELRLTGEGADLTKWKEKITSALPVAVPRPYRDQVPVTVAEYRRLGFPEAGQTGSWLKRDLADFHRALASMPSNLRESFPGADGDYGKSAFGKITKLETSFPSLRFEDQAAMLDLVAAIHETYRRAHNEDRVRYDREISLIRGVYVAMTDHALRKMDVEMSHVKSRIASATGTLGRGSEVEKKQRLARVNSLLQPFEAEIARDLQEARKMIEGFLKDMAEVPTVRPQAKMLTLRYLERHLASVQRQMGGDYRKWLRLGHDQSREPEVKELYRRVLATLDSSP